jgi:hypothetical protein
MPKLICVFAALLAASLIIVPTVSQAADVFARAAG